MCPQWTLFSSRNGQRWAGCARDIRMPHELWRKTRFFQVLEVDARKNRNLRDNITKFRYNDVVPIDT
jgi:hypothetical protein